MLCSGCPHSVCGHMLGNKKKKDFNGMNELTLEDLSIGNCIFGLIHMPLLLPRSLIHFPVDLMLYWLYFI